MPCAGVSANLSVSAIIIVADSQLATGFLDDRWRDGLAIVGAVGVLLTLLGVGIAIWQLYKTQSATAAAVQAINDSKERYETYVVGHADRLLSEAKLLVQSEKWQLAAIRLDDMAGFVMQFAAADDEWGELAATLRDFSVQFERVANGKLKPDPVRNKWHKAQQKLSQKLGQHHGPFLSVQQEQNNDTR